jgi:nicotinate-nucleotide adenylyltransferase
MRVGILGGSFDPPHIGHLLIAQDAMSALALDRLLVVPAAQQPLKTGHGTSALHRLQMARLTFQWLPGVDVDPVEIERGGLSFMVDTVENLRRRLPSAMLFLLVGEDVVETLPRWRESERLRQMVQVVVLRRVVATLPSGSSSEQHDAPGPPVQHLASRLVDVSSTEIRTRVQDGRSIRGFVADAVADYIASTGLYLRDPVAEDVSARA